MLEHFGTRTHIRFGAAHGDGQFAVAQHCGDVEVGQVGVAVLVQDDVLRLDVSTISATYPAQSAFQSASAATSGHRPVDDALAAQVVERRADLAQVQHDGLLAEGHVLLQVVAQVAAQQQVHHHEQVLDVCVIAKTKRHHKSPTYTLSIS